MGLRYEITPTQYGMRVYDEHHPTDYVAHSLIWIHGDSGVMTGFVGPRMYEAIADHGADICQRCNVASLEGFMSDAHYRLLRIKTHGQYEITSPRRGICAGRDMPLVVVRPMTDNIKR